MIEGFQVQYKVETGVVEPSSLAKDMAENMNNSAAEGWAVHDTSITIEDHGLARGWIRWVVTYVRDVDEIPEEEEKLTQLRHKS